MDAVEGTFERVLSREGAADFLVMKFGGRALETDLDVGDVVGKEASGDGVVDQPAVGDDLDANTVCMDGVEQVEDVRAGEGFTAGDGSVSQVKGGDQSFDALLCESGVSGFLGDAVWVVAVGASKLAVGGDFDGNAVDFGAGLHC